MKRISSFPRVLSLALIYWSSPVVADEVGEIETYLRQGQLTLGAAAMQKRIEANPSDHQAGFSLGMVQFFQAIEGLGQDQYRFGLLGGRSRSIPFMRLPIEENEQPEQISYDKARAIIQQLLDRLQTAEQTLSSVKPDDVELRLNLGQVRLDLNADGELTDAESLWHISQVLQNPRLTNESAELNDFPVAFDGGDVIWLRGYCHALMAMGEVILAHDWRDQFERVAHLFYPNVDTPYPFLIDEGPGVFMSFGAQNLLDFVAWLHTINYEVVEPKRMRKALLHLETVVRLSRLSWKLIESETDDNQEWVPNEQQTSLMGGFAVRAEVVAGWHEFLDEVERILQGKRLVPFWRGIRGGIAPNVKRIPQHPNLGINVRRVFTEPRRFDLALWIQGTAATPYLEKGDIASPEKWRTMMGKFNGRFFNFALWFN